VLHPVGPLAPGVYWRRRLVVLLVLLLILGGLGWLGWTLWTGRASGSAPAAAATAAERTPVPRLEQVVPSVASIRTPTAPLAEEAPATGAAPPDAVPPEDVPCTDEMIDLAVRAPATVPVGSKPTLELVVTNSSGAPCRRAVDKGLQEIVLLDDAGTRVWGSNDCFPEQSSDTRTLAPGEAVVLPVVWGGLTSEPTCTAPRTPPAPGDYALRGRLDTRTSGDTPITLT
jgi:hypothetical protein